MPELPEVETIARQLHRLVVGKRVADFTSLWHRVTEPLPAELFAARLAGRRIVSVGRRGKLVVLELDGGEALIVSLRMTGRLLFEPGGVTADPYTRALIRFADGSVLRFADTRKFGRMAIVDLEELTAAPAVPARAPGGEGRPAHAGPVSGGVRRSAHRAAVPLHRSLGIEPLSRRFTARWLAELLHRRSRAAIKPLLLDQRAIAGIGNIYAIEALWRVRLHPSRTAGSLRADEVARLREAITWVLRKGIRFGGASRRDYRDATGKQGRMQREFNVYGRAGEPCPRCGREIVRTVVGGRGTFHCPRCQRAPSS